MLGISSAVIILCIGITGLCLLTGRLLMLADGLKKKMAEADSHLIVLTEGCKLLAVKVSAAENHLRELASEVQNVKKLSTGGASTKAKPKAKKGAASLGNGKTH